LSVKEVVMITGLGFESQKLLFVSTGATGLSSVSVMVLLGADLV
jgi:hypothetical protein